MTGRERRLLRMLCMTAGGGGGGDKPWEEMTWDDVIAATKNGKYKDFEIGAMKELDLGSDGIVHMQIVGIDVDELADGSGYAPLTFISKELLATRHRMNPALTPSSAPYNEGTGTIGGWEKSEMRFFLKETVKQQIPSNVCGAIRNVKKYSRIYDVLGNVASDSETIDDIWIPSIREIGGTWDGVEQLGPAYTDFTDNPSRVKISVSEKTAKLWTSRSAGSTSGFYSVYPSGAIGTTANATVINGVALGFCL